MGRARARAATLTMRRAAPAKFFEWRTWLASFAPAALTLPDGTPVMWVERTELEALAQTLFVAPPDALRSFAALTRYVASLAPSERLPDPNRALGRALFAWLIARGELAPDFLERAERGPPATADDETF